MSEAPLPSYPRRNEVSDLDVARVYSYPQEGPIYEFIGAPGSSDPLEDPQQLQQAAADTAAYLEARPPQPSAVPHPDQHYYDTMGPTDAQKTARQLVDEWVEASINGDKTRERDIKAALRQRVEIWRGRSADPSKPGHRPDSRAVFETLEALRVRKERLRRLRLEAPAFVQVEVPSTEEELPEGWESDGDPSEPEEPPPEEPLDDPPQDDEEPPPPLPPPLPQDDSSSAPSVAPASPAPPARRPMPYITPLGPSPRAGPFLQARSPVALADEEPASRPASPAALLVDGARQANDAAKYHTGRLWQWLHDPDKGRRRHGLLGLSMSAASVAGGLALGYFFGHHSPPKFLQTATISDPQVDTSIGQGHQYIWGAYEDQYPTYGGGQVSQAILDDVSTLRQHGWQVDVWHNQDVWGISPTVKAPPDQYVYFPDNHIEHLNGQTYEGVPGRVGALEYADSYQHGRVISADEAERLTNPLHLPSFPHFLPHQLQAFDQAQHRDLMSKETI